MFHDLSLGIKIKEVNAYFMLCHSALIYNIVAYLRSFQKIKATLGITSLNFESEEV